MLASELAWVPEGACRDPRVDKTIFFPEGNSSDLVAARKVCRTCPVIGLCLAYALKYGEEGVWGGTSERQRRSMRVRMGVAR
jgi:WhiB family redox-sensing transcriptional regulator